MVTSSVLVVLFSLNFVTFISLSLGLPYEDSGRVGARNEAFYDEVRQLLSLNHEVNHVSSLYLNFITKNYCINFNCIKFTDNYKLQQTSLTLPQNQIIATNCNAN